MPGRANPVMAPDSWSAIHERATPLLLDPALPPTESWVANLLAMAPFSWRSEGPAQSVATQFADAPPALQDMLHALAIRFSDMMGTPSIAVRVEGVTGDACTRVHADYTDIRLIQTLAGPGTDYSPPGAPQGPLERVPTGWIGLFKGLAYPGADGCCHAPCLHRSPPISTTGERRLMVVIDTVHNG